MKRVLVFLAALAGCFAVGASAAAYFTGTQTTTDTVTARAPYTMFDFVTLNSRANDPDGLYDYVSKWNVTGDAASGSNATLSVNLGNRNTLALPGFKNFPRLFTVRAATTWPAGVTSVSVQVDADDSTYFSQPQLATINSAVHTEAQTGGFVGTTPLTAATLSAVNDKRQLNLTTKSFSGTLLASTVNTTLTVRVTVNPWGTSFTQKVPVTFCNGALFC